MLRRPVRLGLVVVSVLLSIVLMASTNASAAQATSPLHEHINKLLTLQEQINKQLNTTHGGVQISANTVSYEGGSVRVVFPEFGSQSVATQPGYSANPQLVTNVHGCPTGFFTHWYCFYADVNWAGRKLEFKNCGHSQSLADYGFANDVSSWVNTSGHTIYGYERLQYFSVE